MAWGVLINVHFLLPYYLQVLAGIAKPVFNLFAFGPPTSLIDGERAFLSTDMEEQANASQEPLAKIIKRELLPSVFFFLYLVCLVTDLSHIYKAFTEKDFTWTHAIGEAVMDLAPSANIVAMICMLALTALFSKITVLPEMLALRENAIPDRIDSMGLLKLVAIPSLFLFGSATGIWTAPLDHEAVARMPSAVQRAYVKSLYYTYKLPYHILFACCLPGLVAYLWGFIVFLGLLMVFVEFVGFPHMLRPVLRARWIVGADSGAIAAALNHAENHDVDWKWYLLAPACLAILLPVASALSVRLLAGEGYVAAMVATYEDRHAAAYFGALWAKAMGMENKVAWIAYTISSFF